MRKGRREKGDERNEDEGCEIFQISSQSENQSETERERERDR